MSIDTLDAVEPTVTFLLANDLIEEARRQEPVQHYHGRIRFSGGGLALRMLTGGVNHIAWNTREPESIKVAEAVWQQAASYGMQFYNEVTYEDLRVRAKFDPSTAPEATVIVAPMAGG